MFDHKLYTQITKRKSTRNYDVSRNRYLNEHLDLSEINEFIKNLKPLDDSIKVDFKIVSGKVVNKHFMKEAPFYVAAFSEKKEHYLENIGFMLEQLDLYFSLRGIGSCWQGFPKPTKKLLNSSDLDFVIFFVFGRTTENVYRFHKDQFKRKSVDEITDIVGMDSIFNLVRLAPSSINSQPWYFTGNYDSINVFCKQKNRFNILNKESSNRIDIGIVLLFLVLNIEEESKKYNIVFDEGTDEKVDGYYYVCTVNIKE